MTKGAMKERSSKAKGRIIEIRMRFSMYKPPIGLNRTRNIVQIEIRAMNNIAKPKLNLLQ